MDWNNTLKNDNEIVTLGADCTLSMKVIPRENKPRETVASRREPHTNDVAPEIESIEETFKNSGVMVEDKGPVGCTLLISKGIHSIKCIVEFPKGYTGTNAKLDII